MSTGSTAVATVDKPRNQPIATVKRSTEMINAYKGQIVVGLPSHLNADQFINDCKVAFAKNPDLLQCHELSVMNSIRQAATLGLRIDGVLGHGYLVPYKSDCTFIAGYRGLVELCRRSGQVKLFEAHIVRPGDSFDFEFGTSPKLSHRPSRKQDDLTKWEWVYACCTLHTGEVQFDVMSYEEIMYHKNKYAKGTDRATSPWKTAEMEMAKKTVTRRLVKYLPVSPDIIQMAMADEYEEAGVLHDQPGRAPNARVVEMEFGEPENDGSDDGGWKNENQQASQQANQQSSGNMDAKQIEDEVQAMFIHASLKGLAEVERVYDQLCGPDGPYVVTEKLGKWIESCREIAKRRVANGGGGGSRQKEFT